MNIKEALELLIAGRSLTQPQMRQIMLQLMTGELTDAQIGAFLVALRIKGESVDEIAGAVEVMRELVTPVRVQRECLVDTCGTGGDGSNLFNVSTASAFVAAAAGVSVAKHGNRSVTSSTGSADVLEYAGVNLSLTAEQVARTVDSVGLGFMFAPAHHSAMKPAIGPRKELALRTIFNVLGPLTNPAGARRQIIGVFNKGLCLTVAHVLQRLGSEHVMVVHSESGLDEIALDGTTFIAELKGGTVAQYTISPSDFGMTAVALDDLVVGSAKESYEVIEAALTGVEGKTPDKARQTIALNAGAAIYVGAGAATLGQGVAMAEDIISSGLAFEKLKELAEFSACFSSD